MTRGVFIVFAGINGSGKTSIINNIVDKMNNSNFNNNNNLITINKKSDDIIDDIDDIDCINDDESFSKKMDIKLWNVFKFPNRTTVIGKKIDLFLKKKLVLNSKGVELKFFSDNRREFFSEMMFLLKSGYNIICDRYVYCSVAYTITNQSLDIINNKNINILTMNEIIKYDINLIKPDHVFLINGDYINLRNETTELYHRDNVFNKLLFNNYLLTLMHTKTEFTIVENTFGELDNICNKVLEKVRIIQEDPKFIFSGIKLF